jgi:hypothetical protein
LNILSIWESYILPEAPKVAPPPSGPSAFEELDALLQVEKGIGGEGIAKEHSYATILFKKDNKLKKLVYVKDVFEPSQLLWHRGSDLSKVQDLSRCATILDITNEKVTFNFREEEVILEIKTKNVNAHGRPLGTGGSPPVESKLITENHWKISKEERDQVLKKTRRLPQTSWFSRLL